jgi:ABC-type Mn2+/Zn2+ transport system permease subunit
MRRMFAHITPLETPILWFAFAAGIAAGVVGTLLVQRRAAARKAS